MKSLEREVDRLGRLRIHPVVLFFPPPPNQRQFGREALFPQSSAAGTTPTVLLLIQTGDNRSLRIQTGSSQEWLRHLCCFGRGSDGIASPPVSRQTFSLSV